jgi:hypothetical protein
MGNLQRFSKGSNTSATIYILTSLHTYIITYLHHYILTSLHTYIITFISIHIFMGERGERREAEGYRMAVEESAGAGGGAEEA